MGLAKLKAPFSHCIFALLAVFFYPAMARAETDFLARVSDWLADPRLLLARKALIFIGLLLVFWIAAALLASLLHSLFRRVGLDRGLASALGIEPSEKPLRSPAYIISRLAYWLVVLFGLVAALNYADLAHVAQPLEGLISSLVRGLPAVIYAGIILGVAFIVGTILRRLVSGILGKTGLDSRLREMGRAKIESKKVFSQTVGAFVFWAVLFIGLIGALDVLRLQTLAQPLSDILHRALSLLPALATATIILLAGYLLGRLAQTVVGNILHSLGLDSVPERLHLERLFQTRSASDAIGWLAFLLILVHAIIAAADQLTLTALSQPLTQMTEQFWVLLPKVFLAILILAAAVFVGRFLGDLVKGILGGVGFDDFLARMGLRFGESEAAPAEAARERLLDRPSALVGGIIQLAVVLVAVAQVLSTLGLVVWGKMVRDFLSYTFLNALVALVIIGIGFALGNYLRDTIRSRGAASDAGRQWIASAVRIAVLIFALTMAIQQLAVAPTFVLLTFGLVFGAFCLALALAFGLGARDVAQDIVRKQYNRAGKVETPEKRTF